MTEKTRKHFYRQLFTGKDLPVGKRITIHSPKIKDILAFGEERYFSVIRNLISVPPAEILYSLLPNKDIDYRVKADLDFIYFSTVIQNLTIEDTKLIFGDLDLSKFQLAQKDSTKEFALYDTENDIVIERYKYEIMMDYISLMHNLDRDKYTSYKSANEFLEKHLLINSDKKQQREYESLLLPWIEENPAYLNLTFFALFNLLKIRFSLDGDHQYINDI